MRHLLKSVFGKSHRRYHDIYPAAPSRGWRRFPNHALALSAAALLFVGASGFLLIRSTLNAETLTLYPGACLGGWQNPERAQGELTEDASNLHAFAEGSSAILPADTVSEIFCGGFIADIPPNTEPTTLTLLLAWSTERADEPPVVSGEDFGSSTGELLDAPDGSSPSFELIEPEDDAPVIPEPEPVADDPPPEPPAEPEPPPEPEPRIEPEPAPEPVSFLRSLAAVAHAQEEPSPLEEEAPDVPGEVPPLEEAPVVLPDSAFVEVRYTFDGSTWYSLGTFDDAHIVPTTFSIPVPPQTSWTNLSSFQISVRSSPTIDGAPTVYLDGMELRVGYDPLTETRFFADKNLYATTDFIVITSSEPRSAVEIYWLDDPDTAPEASNVYAAIVGDDGTVTLEAKTLFPGTFALVNTTTKWHCSNFYLSQCLAHDALGQAVITVALPEDIPGILAAHMASTTASTTPPEGGAPDSSGPSIIEVPLAPEEGNPSPPSVESPEPPPQPVVPLEDDVPDAPSAE